jgi:hypothetical protein
MIGSSLLSTLTRRSAARLDRSMPFMNMDYVFERFPNLAKDKVQYMTRLLQGSFLAGIVFIFAFVNPPYQGADYENASKSLYYKWKHNQLEKSGQLHENLRIKRDYFYSPGGPADPMAKLAEPADEE